MLLDTSGLLCCFDADDYRHRDAVEAYKAAPVRLTHNYVLAEFVALAQTRRLPREAALLFAGTVANSWTRVIRCVTRSASLSCVIAA